MHTALTIACLAVLGAIFYAVMQVAYAVMQVARRERQKAAHEKVMQESERKGLPLLEAHTKAMRALAEAQGKVLLEFHQKAAKELRRDEDWKEDGS